jgi:fatty-acyl-CoA synthase
MIRIDDKLHDPAQIKAASAQAAEEIGLTAAGPRHRYAVCFQDTFEWLALFFAIRAAGASVLPLHPSTPRAAALRLAEQAGCTRLCFHSLKPEVLPGRPLGEDEEGELLQMSSGTTGAPKCVARGWSDIAHEVGTYVTAFRQPNYMTPVIACPTTHSYGLICGLLVALARGQQPVIVNIANPKYLLKVLREVERPLLYSSPAVLHTLSRLTPADQKIHAVMTSGTLLPSAWFSAIRAKATHMFQQYGCSEAGCIAVNPDVTAPEDMGFVLPRHRLQTGTSADAAGEIVVHGARGAIRTGDLGYARADGMLVFVSRMDDTINVSGLNVYPREVEDVAMAMPGVTDAVAFRVADAFAGERVGLLFSASRPVTGTELRDWCGRHLASHQVPMEIVETAEVPRQANGKISRREVARLHAEGHFDMVTGESA